MDFKRRLTEKGKLERKGPAVLAAGVFDKKKWSKIDPKTEENQPQKGENS